MNQAILVADDHPLFRQALTYIIQSVLPDSDIVHAVDYAQALSHLEKDPFTMAFLDLNMPDSNGLLNLAFIKKQYPNIPFVVVSANEDHRIIRTCLEYKAAGYIMKSSDPADIKEAIKTILSGDTFIPKGINPNELILHKDKSEFEEKISLLTPSQLRILIEIAEGKLNKQIAYDLNIKESTVKAHITSIFKKLGINNRTQAVLLLQKKDSPIH